MVQKGWRLPEYTVTQESGPAHRKEFTMTCRVERFVEIGTLHKPSFFHSVCCEFRVCLNYVGYLINVNGKHTKTEGHQICLLT